MTLAPIDLFVPAVEEQTFGLDFDAALLLAARHGGSVTAYHAVPDVAFVANANPLWDRKEVEANYGERCRIRAERLKALFDEKATDACHWVSEQGDPAALAPRAARNFDLVMIHNRGMGDQLNLTDLHQNLLARSGKGVVFLPAAMRKVPETVLIAWNGSREAARAVDAAWPLVRGARKVDVVTVGEGVPHAPDADAIAARLRRRGVEAAVLEIGDGARDVGGQIDRAAGDIGAELLVMGAYGHARWREAVLGGVTRHALTEPKRPTLMAH